MADAKEVEAQENTELSKEDPLPKEASSNQAIEQSTDRPAKFQAEAEQSISAYARHTPNDMSLIESETTTAKRRNSTKNHRPKPKETENPPEKSRGHRDANGRLRKDIIGKQGQIYEDGCCKYSRKFCRRTQYECELTGENLQREVKNMFRFRKLALYSGWIMFVFHFYWSMNCFYHVGDTWEHLSEKEKKQTSFADGHRVHGSSLGSFEIVMAFLTGVMMEYNDRAHRQRTKSFLRITLIIMAIWVILSSLAILLVINWLSRDGFDPLSLIHILWFLALFLAGPRVYQLVHFYIHVRIGGRLKKDDETELEKELGPVEPIVTVSQEEPSVTDEPSRLDHQRSRAQRHVTEQSSRRKGHVTEQNQQESVIKPKRPRPKTSVRVVKESETFTMTRVSDTPTRVRDTPKRVSDRVPEKSKKSKARKNTEQVPMYRYHVKQ